MANCAAKAMTLLGSCAGHEYLRVPPARTGDCLVNAVVMGEKVCRIDQHAYEGEDVQCGGDPSAYERLFQLHSAYDGNACGGSIGVHAPSNLQYCGTVDREPEKFDMTLEGPEETTRWTAGSEVELRVHGFFHQGVNRVALCFLEDHDCNSPDNFMDYVLGYQFSESANGVNGQAFDPSCDMPFKVRLPNRNGKAVLQWLVDAEDVRSYVSCTDVELTGASLDGHRDDAYTCNGHPLCNCTISDGKGPIGIGQGCPMGTKPVADFLPKTGIIEEYKAQLGVEEFCALCLTNGCPSTCGGAYNGVYQGPRCSHEPVLPGCGHSHATSLPRYIACTQGTCGIAGRTVSREILSI